MKLPFYEHRHKFSPRLNEHASHTNKALNNRVVQTVGNVIAGASAVVGIHEYVQDDTNALLVAGAGLVALAGFGLGALTGSRARQFEIVAANIETQTVEQLITEGKEKKARRY